MKELGLQIDPWILNRLMSSTVDTNTGTIKIAAHEVDATPASIFPGVVIEGVKLENEPFEFVCHAMIFSITLLRNSR